MSWVKIRLADACIKIGSGATPKGGSSVYLNCGEIALIRSQNVHNEGFSEKGLVFLNEALARGMDNVVVKEWDVLLNITGDSVARTCLVDGNVLPARVNQHVAIIRTNHDVLSPVYLRYFLISPSMQARMLSVAAVGATRNALTKSMIESFSIFAPKDVRDQEAIVKLPFSIDKKIALNGCASERLEEIARTYLKIA